MIHLTNDLLTHHWPNDPSLTHWPITDLLTHHWPTDPSLTHWPITDPLTHHWPANPSLTHWPITASSACDTPSRLRPETVAPVVVVSSRVHCNQTVTRRRSVVYCARRRWRSRFLWWRHRYMSIVAVLMSWWRRRNCSDNQPASLHVSVLIQINIVNNN